MPVVSSNVTHLRPPPNSEVRRRSESKGTVLCSAPEVRCATPNRQDQPTRTETAGSSVRLLPRDAPVRQTTPLLGRSSSNQSTLLPQELRMEDRTPPSRERTPILRSQGRTDTAEVLPVRTPPGRGLADAARNQFFHTAAVRTVSSGLSGTIPRSPSNRNAPHSAVVKVGGVPVSPLVAKPRQPRPQTDVKCSLGQNLDLRGRSRDTRGVPPPSPKASKQAGSVTTSARVTPVAQSNGHFAPPRSNVEKQTSRARSHDPRSVQGFAKIAGGRSKPAPFQHGRTLRDPRSFTKLRMPPRFMPRSRQESQILKMSDTMLVIEQASDGFPPTPPPSPQATRVFGYRASLAADNSAVNKLLEQVCVQLQEIAENEKEEKSEEAATVDIVTTPGGSQNPGKIASFISSDVQHQVRERMRSLSMEVLLAAPSEEQDAMSVQNQFVVVASPQSDKVVEDDVAHSDTSTELQEDADGVGEDEEVSVAEVVVPEVGDIVVLGVGAPAEYRGSSAVVTKVAAAHCTVVVLDQNHRFGAGECWPSFDDVLIQNCRGRLGTRVIIDGLKGAKTKRLNGLRGTISEHPREGHPTFIRKAAAPLNPQLTLCVELDEPDAGEKLVLLEPRFLMQYDQYMENISSNLGKAIADMGLVLQAAHPART
uniref:Uncharacterized protein n=1 Tax=Noctiluca scintillans TaxID=2966 RepID=A0A7S1A9Y4_NOCSC|mmetsp:Transcript_37630/g.100089  ORF Transcript_37630/g.100089 Transcript_37630/m.100089 type:complete len:650 (+) Transcript_37630:59-2008(+)